MAKKKAVKKVVAKKDVEPKPWVRPETTTVNTGDGPLTIDMSKESVPETVSIPSATTGTFIPVRVLCPNCEAFDSKTSKCCLNPHPQPTMGSDDWCMAAMRR